MQVLGFLLARFSEPSSYAGLGAVLALTGLHFSDSDLGQLAQFLAAGCGLVALLLKERGLIPMIAVALLLGGTLTACGALAAAGSAVGAAGGGLAVADHVAGSADAAIRAACGEYERGRDAAEAVIAAGAVSAGAAARVRIIEEYGDAACASPPQGDALSTAIWLGRLAGQIAALTSVELAQP